jgi:hypothetical protein
MVGRKPIKDKSTEKSERLVVYLTKEQMDRMKRFAKKLGQPVADSSTVRIALMQFLEQQGIN